MGYPVFPRETTSLPDRDGIRWNVQKNVPWDSDAEIVKVTPSAFSDKPTELLGTRRGVEQATAAPGERRGRVG